MIRVDSPWGRLYKVKPGLILPSVTTVLKGTAKRPFTRAIWRKKLETKGLSDYEAQIYAEHWISQGFTPALAFRHVEGFIETPMKPEQADHYMDWKSEHSSRRGSELHEFLENTLPIGKEITLAECPQVENQETQRLVDSLWEAEILQRIKRVESVEQRLWWYADGVGFAGTEDICYRTTDDRLFSADWKSKDPKPYCHSKYDHEYRIQLVAYAGARAARTGMTVDGLHINFCHSDGSPGAQSVVEHEELSVLWDEWMIRLRAWWATIGTELQTQRNA